MIYSFYGRLSVSNNNVDELRAGNIPPTFYTYGTEDPFYRQFNQNVEAVRRQECWWSRTCWKAGRTASVCGENGPRGSTISSQAS